jgi:hypothetical protein
MKKNSIIILFASVVALTSCSYQTKNRIEQDDLNKDNERIYGVSPDSAAAQLKNVYTPNPENEARATAIKNKLYGAPTSAPTEGPAVAADTTAK